MRIRPRRYDSRDPNANPLWRIIAIIPRSAVGILVKQQYAEATHYRRLNGDIKTLVLEKEDGPVDFTVTRGEYEALAGVPGKYEFDTLGRLMLENQIERVIEDGTMDIQIWWTMIEMPKGTWGQTLEITDID